MARHLTLRQAYINLKAVFIFTKKPQGRKAQPSVIVRQGPYSQLSEKDIPGGLTSGQTALTLK